MSATAFVAEVWGVQGTAYAVVAVRYYAKVSQYGWASLAWDDGLMLLATLVYTAESVAAYYAVAYWDGLANNAMTDAQRAALDPASREWLLRVNGSKTHVIGLLLYGTTLWLLKGCWVAYYARWTKGIADRYVHVRIAAVVIPVAYASCLLVAFFQCVPFHHQWQIYPSPGDNCMPAISTLQTVTVMVMNTVTDIYLMMIPIPMVWKAQLPWRKKLSVTLLFSGGILKLAFGLMRCISILTVGDVDPAQSGFWSVRESFVSFVVTNLPSLYPLIKGYLDKTRTSTNTRGGHYNNGNTTTNKNTNVMAGDDLHHGDGGGEGGGSHKSYRLDSLPGTRRSSKNAAPVGGSQEHIVAPRGHEREQQQAASSHSHAHAHNNHHHHRDSSQSSLDDEASSLDSFSGLAAYHVRVTRPGLGAGMSRATASAEVSAGRSSSWPPAEGGVGPKGIFVTRRYEVTEA